MVDDGPDAAGRAGASDPGTRPPGADHPAERRPEHPPEHRVGDVRGEPDDALADELADSFALDEVERRPRHRLSPEPEPEPQPQVPEPPARVSGPVLEPESRPADTASWAVTDRPPGEVDRRTARRRRRLRRYRSPWWELPALVLLAIAIAVLVKSFVVQPFYIPSQSMEKTLHGCPGCSGDRILVNKLIYDFRDPHPGDIVVFHAPPDWNEVAATQPPSNPVLRVVRGFGQLVGFVPPDGMILVKRVIATGGQSVRGVDGRVQVSDHGDAGPWRTLDEPYVFLDGNDPRATFGPVTVPKDRLWVMGDHRNDSADSRYHCDAAGSSSAGGPSCDPTTSTVATDEVIGKAFVIAWPPSRWRTLGTPATFDTSAQAATLAGDALPLLLAGACVVPVYLIRRRARRDA